MGGIRPRVREVERWQGYAPAKVRRARSAAARAKAIKKQRRHDEALAKEAAAKMAAHAKKPGMVARIKSRLAFLTSRRAK